MSHRGPLPNTDLPFGGKSWANGGLDGPVAPTQPTHLQHSTISQPSLNPAGDKFIHHVQVDTKSVVVMPPNPQNVVSAPVREATVLLCTTGESSDSLARW